MRYVVARRLGRRGEGLGNEMLPWAKGLIASQVLHATLVGPSWGLNKRRYYRNFGTSRLDFVLEDLLQKLPHHRFTEADYRQTGLIDFGQAIEQWARQKGILEKSSFTVTVDGMYGGYPSIRNARSFLISKLLNSRDTIRNMYEVESKLDPSKLFVAVHMRFGGDFLTLNEGESARSQFNIRIPGEWYFAACEALRQQFGDRLQFYFFTDRGGPEFDEAVRRFNPGQTRQQGLTECSDLMLMSRADLRICSVSSYSLIASFFSEGPYLWYEPQLTYDDALYTLWGAEEGQRLPGSLTQRNMEAVRNVQPHSDWETAFHGYAYLGGDALPPGLMQQLQQKLLSKSPAASLLNYGCLPEWTRGI